MKWNGIEKWGKEVVLQGEGTASAVDVFLGHCVRDG
jgi:hypothetical protein